MDRRALVAGVQTWLDPGVRPREGVSAALRRVAERLEAGGWTVRLLVDDAPDDQRRPLLGNLLDGLHWLADGDEALGVLSGRTHEGHFLPRDVRLRHLDRTALPLAELSRELPTHAGLILDAEGEVAGLRWWSAAAGEGYLERVLEAIEGAPVLSGAFAFDGHRFGGVRDVEILDAGARRPRRCVACGRDVGASGASFCPGCGASLPTTELLDSGRYRLLRTLGQGGMGQVFLAEDTRLGVRRALKVLSVPAELPPDEVAALRQRMIQEARAAQALGEQSHHVVRVFDVGFSPERQEPFLVMELLEGETLAQRLARGRMRPAAAVELGRTLAETLALAHRRDMVHRDLKPENVMLAQRGGGEQVKVLDFGLVKMTEARVKTQSGRMMGTLQYMPPEQLRGDAVDARADVYALGALLYECLSGRRANPGRTQQEIFAVLLDKGVAPLTEVAPGLPEALCALVDRCLELDREKRPADAGEVATALGALGPVDALPATPSGLEATLPASAPVALPDEASGRAGASSDRGGGEVPAGPESRAAAAGSSSSMATEHGAPIPPTAARSGPEHREQAAQAATEHGAPLPPTAPRSGPEHREQAAQAATASLARGEVSLPPSSPGVRAPHWPVAVIGLGLVGALALLLWPSEEEPARVEARVALRGTAAPVDAAAPPLDAAVDAAPDVAPSLRAVEMPRELPAPAGERVDEGDTLVYRGAPLSALMARLVVDVTLDDPGEWPALAPVHPWLAATVALDQVQTDGERLVVPALLVDRRKVERARIAGVGQLVIRGKAAAFLSANCGGVRPGDALREARWQTLGYGGGRCRGAECARRLSAGIRKGRGTGELTTVTLSLERAGEETSARCRFRP